MTSPTIIHGEPKFKRLEQDLGDDAYQLLAYLLEFGPRSGFLIAASGTRTDRRVRAVDKILGVRPLALDRPPDEVLAEVDALADETINLDPDRVHKVIAVQPLKVLDGLLDETT